MYGKLTYICLVEGDAMPALKQARLEARVTEQQKRTIERAAELHSTSVTAFVTQAATQAAIQVIQEHATLNLNAEAQRVFVDALLNPPKPNYAALAAARRYKRRMRL